MVYMTCRGKISQSPHWVNSSAQGSKQKVTRKNGAYFYAECSKKMQVWITQKDEKRWITLILTFSDICLQHALLQLLVFCLPNERYSSRPSRDKLQIAAPNSNVSQPCTWSDILQSMFTLLHALFTSSSLKHTDNYQIGGHQCIGDLAACTMI